MMKRIEAQTKIAAVWKGKEARNYKKKVVSAEKIIARSWRHAQTDYMDSAMPVLRPIDKERGRELQRQMEMRYAGYEFADIYVDGGARYQPTWNRPTPWLYWEAEVDPDGGAEVLRGELRL